MEFLKRFSDALLLLVRSLFDPLYLFKPLPASVSPAGDQRPESQLGDRHRSQEQLVP